MFINKLFASTFLVSNSYLLAKQHSLKAECAESGAEKGATDLDRIFAGDGGMPPDPEEI